MTTLAIPVANGNSDANEISGVMSLTNTGIVIDGSNEWAAWQFVVNVPQGTALTDAYLDITLFNADSNDEPSHTFYGEAVDNAAAFSTTANDISSRARTTASVNWSNPDLGLAAGTQVTQTPSLLAIVQEIIDRPGWVSGNTLTIMVQGSSSARDLFFVFYEQSSSSSTTLNISYSDTQRSVPASAALSGSFERDVAASAAFSLTGITRTATASAALQATLARNVPASAATKSIFAHTVPASASTSSEGTLRTVKASASIIRPELDGGYDLDSGLGEPDGTGARRHWRGIRQGDYVNAHLPYAGVGGSSPLLRLLSRTYTTGDLALECDWQYISMQTEARRPGPLGQPNPKVISDDLEGIARRSTRRTDSRGRLAKVR